MNTIPVLGRAYARARTRRILIFVAVGALLLFGIVLIGEDIVRHLDAIELWIAGLGIWAVVAFIGLYVLATSMMVPESVLSIAAGAVFGIALGLVAVVVASLLAAALQYGLAQKTLRPRINRAVARRPSLSAIPEALRDSERKLQVLLRLTPLNPATVSYLLGAAGVRFGWFLLATLAVFPHLLLEVYFGFAGKHVARMASGSAEGAYLHDAVVVGGLIVMIFAIVFVSRIARKALANTIPATPVETSESAS